MRGSSRWPGAAIVAALAVLALAAVAPAESSDNKPKRVPIEAIVSITDQGQFSYKYDDKGMVAGQCDEEWHPWSESQRVDVSYKVTYDHVKVPLRDETVGKPYTAAVNPTTNTWSWTIKDPNGDAQCGGDGSLQCNGLVNPNKGFLEVFGLGPPNFARIIVRDLYMTSLNATPCVTTQGIGPFEPNEQVFNYLDASGTEDPLDNLTGWQAVVGGRHFFNRKNIEITFHRDQPKEVPPPETDCTSPSTPEDGFMDSSCSQVVSPATVTTKFHVEKIVRGSPTS